VTPVNNARALGPQTSWPRRANQRSQPKATGRNVDEAQCLVGDHGRLSGFIVPQRKSAKESRPSRGVGKGVVGFTELLLGNMTDTQRLEHVFTVQQRIAQVARERPHEVFTSLNHYLDVEWLRVAYERFKPDSAPGIDGQSWVDYGQDLEKNLCHLLDRVKSGSYVAPPVKRVYIPKGDGKETRPIGMPTVADRVAQMVVKRYLEPKLEPLFHADSYGYRPFKSAHDAVGQARKRCWRFDRVLDLDIKGFFDNISHELMMRAVRKHAREKWVVLYIERWLKALAQDEHGRLTLRDKGTPQESSLLY
jgi:retron-type reverse transcriptase